MVEKGGDRDEDAERVEASFGIVHAGYLCESACYQSSLVLDERPILEFAAKNPSHGGDVIVGRAWDLLENVETVHVFDSTSIAAVQSFASGV